MTYIFNFNGKIIKSTSPLVYILDCDLMHIYLPISKKITTMKWYLVVHTTHFITGRVRIFGIY